MSGFTSYNQSLEKIYNAYQQGLLLVHQLESQDVNFGDNQGYLRRFVSVLNDEADSRFISAFRKLESGSGGYKCLATTYLKEGEGQSVFNEFNEVGLLINGNDSKNLSYVLASPIDLNSYYDQSKDELAIRARLGHRTRDIVEKQITNCIRLSEVSLASLNIGDERDCLVKAAIKEIGEWKKENNTNEVNEVLVNAHLNAVCGVVYSEDRVGAGYLIDAKEAFRKDMGKINTLALAAFLKGAYNMDLPIMQYNNLCKKGERPLELFVINKEEFESLKVNVKKCGPEYISEEALNKTLNLADQGFYLHQKKINTVQIAG